MHPSMHLNALHILHAAYFTKQQLFFKLTFLIILVFFFNIKIQLIPAVVLNCSFVKSFAWWLVLVDYFVSACSIGLKMYK